MQRQRPGVAALLNKWVAARRARAERAAQRQAETEPEEPDTPEQGKEKEEQDDDVGAGDLLRMVSDVAWRMLIIGVVAGLLVYALIYLSVITLPVIFAVFITALLSPLAGWLRRKGLGRGLSTAVSILTGIVVLSGVVSLIVTPALQGFDALVASVFSAIDELQNIEIPFGLDPALVTDVLDNALMQIQSMITENQDQLLSGAWAAGATVVQMLIGLVLITALTVYFLHSGDKVMDWVVTLLPPKSRPGMRHGGQVAYGVMGRYVRGVAMVGFVDAFGIGIFLIFLIDTNLAIPLIVLTFIGAFLPIIGAFLTGLLAALVAFVTEGWIVALIVIAVVVTVQQLESSVFAPRIYGQALDLPSPIVLISITTGAALGNVAGMFLATPVAAVFSALLRNRPPTHSDGSTGGSADNGKRERTEAETDAEGLSGRDGEGETQHSGARE